MPERELAYLDRFTNYVLNSLTADTVGDSINNETEFGESGSVFLVLEVDKDSWLKLFSSVMTGADLMYTDEAHEVTWILWKAAKMGTFCTQVATCIDESSGVRGALDRWHVNEGSPGGTGNQEEEIDDIILGQDWLEGLACDDDKLWGACEYVIANLFDITSEILQTIKVATAPLDGLAEILEAVPIIGNALSLAPDVIAWVVDTAADLFEAVDSTAVRDELACHLFCLGKDECKLNMDMLSQVIDVESDPRPPVIGFVDQLEWLLGVVLSGKPNLTIAATIAQMGMIVMRYGGRFGAFVLGVRSVQQAAALGVAVNENNGWEILCTECPADWEHGFQTTNFGEDWEVYQNAEQPFNSVFANNYWSATPPPLSIDINFPDTVITSIKSEYEVVATRSSVNDDLLAGDGENENGELNVVKMGAQSSDTTPGSKVLFDDTETQSCNRIIMYSSYNGGQVRCWRITVTGQGVNPFL